MNWWRRPRLMSALLAVLFTVSTLWIFTLPALALPEDGIPFPEGEKDTILKDLYEPDQKGSLAAQNLIQAILQGGKTVANEAQKARAREYREFLEKRLDPVQLSRRGENVAIAVKLLSAMSYLAIEPLSYPSRLSETPLSDKESFREQVLRLVGIGPENLRRAVRETLRSFIQAERAFLRATDAVGKESVTFQKLGDRLRANSPPPRGILVEMSEVLWEGEQGDKKQLISFLMEGLKRNKGSSEDMGAYIEELRERLWLDFPSIEGWERWWEENRTKPVERLLSTARKAFRERRIELWKRTFQLVQDSANPEKYLLALQDAFDTDFSREMRVAVLNELGTFPAWLRDTRIPEDVPDAVTPRNGGKNGHSRRGVEFLLQILKRSGNYRFISPEVRQAALRALGNFQGILSRSPGLQAEVTDILSLELQRSIELPVLLSGEGEPAVLSNRIFWGEENRRYALETIRTVGALKVSDASIRSHLEGILEVHLKDVAGTQSVPWKDDVELLTEAVSALGKTLKGRGDSGAIGQLLELYGRHKIRAEKKWKDLRKACVSALNVPIQDSDTREKVRSFYFEILEDSTEKAERIPAIIGLGIMAKAGDEESVQGLLDVLGNRDRYDPNEVNAVLDALAYLGGEKALTCFLEYLVARDVAFVDQVWNKVVRILKGGGPDLIEWLVAELEAKGVEKDVTDYAEAIVRLAEDPELKDFFSTEKVNLESKEDFLRFKENAYALVRSLELVGEEAEAVARVSQLVDFVVKNEKAKAYWPDGGAELKTLEARLAQKQELAGVLEGPVLQTPEVLQKQLLEVLVSQELSADERWRNLRWVLVKIQALKPSDTSLRLVELLYNALSGPEYESFWVACPQGARERYLKALDSVRENLKPSAPGPGGLK